MKIVNRPGLLPKEVESNLREKNRSSVFWNAWVSELWNAIQGKGNECLWYR